MDETTPPRRARALQLRLAGADYEQVADHLSCTVAEAISDVDEALGVLEAARQGERVDQLELARLDVMFTALWPAVRKGDAKAADRCLDIMERRDELSSRNPPAEEDDDRLDQLRAKREARLRGQPRA